MSPLLKTISTLSLPLLLAIGLTSCGEDPELISKREEQRAEIRKLESELSLLNDRLENAPTDRTAELEQLEKKTIAEKQKIAELELEATSLAEKKRVLEAELKEYQRNYPLR